MPVALPLRMSLGLGMSLATGTNPACHALDYNDSKSFHAGKEEENFVLVKQGRQLDELVSGENPDSIADSGIQSVGNFLRVGSASELASAWGIRFNTSDRTVAAVSAPFRQCKPPEDRYSRNGVRVAKGKTNKLGRQAIRCDR